MKCCLLQSIAGVAAVVLSAVTLAGQAPGVENKTATTFKAPRTSWGHPDLQGVWDQTTGTPLERLAEFKERKFLTDKEALEREQARFSEFDQSGRAGGTGDYGSVWREGSKNGLNRTSLIVDPDAGRVPALTPDAQALRQRPSRQGQADSI